MNLKQPKKFLEMVLPKQMRLKGYRCFDYIYKEGSRYYGYSMVLRVSISNSKLQVQKNNLKKKLLSDVQFQ